MKKTNTTEKRYESQSFEFLLYINNHIICQRYFEVPNYNPNVINSTKVKELFDSLTGMNNGEYGELGIIPYSLKQKSINYLWDFYNPKFSSDDEWGRNNPTKQDTFQFEIKRNRRSIGKSEFSGTSFPPKVRYDVDINDIVDDITSEITYFLTLEDSEIL